MSHRPTPRRRLVAAIASGTVASGTIAGTMAGGLAAHVLAAPAAGAQDAEPTDAPASGPPSSTPPTEPPETAPPAEFPGEVPASPPVRTGYAGDSSTPHETELPVAPDPAAPPATEAPSPPPSPERPTDGRASDPMPRSSDEPGPGTRGGGDRAATEPTRTPSTAPAPPAATAPPPPPTQHTVVGGEHLWSIAAARLAEATGRTPETLTAVEIAPYWTQMCMLNAPRLASGDLNLVYPGEVLDLPPLP